MKAATNSPPKKVIVVALVVLTLIAFWGVKDNGFVSYDDETYVLANPQVRAGVSNALWAFTSTAAANWHPFTWLSHILDWQLFGSNPSGVCSLQSLLGVIRRHHYYDFLASYQKLFLRNHPRLQHSLVGR